MTLLKTALAHFIKAHGLDKQTYTVFLLHGQFVRAHVTRATDEMAAMYDAAALNPTADVTVVCALRGKHAFMPPDLGRHAYGIDIAHGAIAGFARETGELY